MYKGKHNKPSKIGRKIKRFILKSITYIMLIIFLISLAALDSEPFYIPLINLIISGGWLYSYCWANDYLIK